MSSRHKFASSLAAAAFSTSISQLLMHHILNSVVICAKTANEFFFFFSIINLVNYAVFVLDNLPLSPTAQSDR